jgi:spore maturation protein CgeB
MIADGHGGEAHEKAYGLAMQEMGHEVSYFTWKEYFHHYPYAEYYQTDGNYLKSIYYRLQNKAKVGPALWRLNKDLVEKCQNTKFDLVFIYRGTHIYSNTIEQIKHTGAKVFGYNNDDPFSNVYRPYFWRHYRKCIPHYDYIFYYRHKNKADYESIGYKNISLLRSSYIEERNFKINHVENSPFKCDVIFVGHFERDGRDKALLNLLKSGVKLEIYGTTWQQSEYYEELKSILGHDIYGLYGGEYNLALNSAKVALVFLSKINNDTYTRRCFEIPAAQTCMLAEYTDDLACNLFIENKEAVYFRDEAELTEKLKDLLRNDEKRMTIAKAGQKKVKSAKHEVRNRAEEVLKIFKGNAHG